MSENRNITVDYFSAGTHLLTTKSKSGVNLARATGFIWEHSGKHYLVTNWHVVTGLDVFTDEFLSDNPHPPHRLTIQLHRQRQGVWEEIDIELFNDDGSRTWKAYDCGATDRYDVAAIPISLPADYSSNVFNKMPQLTDDIRVSVSSTVHIIGYPLSISGPLSLPIWKTGHIASIPELDYQGLPCFLIDASTAASMSGSPVIYAASGQYLSASGNLQIDPGNRYKFLGVYSGRLKAKDGEVSNIGLVWKPSALAPIL